MFNPALGAGASHAQPADKIVMVNGLKIHYLDWGNAGKQPLIGYNPTSIKQNVIMKFSMLPVTGTYAT